MKKIIVSLIVFASLHCWSQETNNKKISFQSNNTIGLLEGEAGSAFQIQTVNGIKFKKTFFAGIGVGIDEYNVRSIPLFLDIRKQFRETGHTPFIYVDGGLNFTWPKEKNPGVSYEQPGWMYDVGIGYRISVKSNAVLLSAGYSFKSYTSKEPNYNYYWFSTYDPKDFRTYDYQLRRISIKAGFSF